MNERAPTDPEAMNQSSAFPLVFGLFFVAIGVFVLCVATDVIRADPGTIHAPRWVLGLCGAAFAGAGLSVIGARWPVVRFASLSVVLLGLGGVAAWASIGAPAEGWSGGIPFVSDTVNVGIARGLAGFGALLCLGLLVYGWKTGFRSANEVASRRGRSDP